MTIEEAKKRVDDMIWEKIDGLKGHLTREKTRWVYADENEYNALVELGEMLEKSLDLLGDIEPKAKEEVKDDEVINPLETDTKEIDVSFIIFP